MFSYWNFLAFTTAPLEQISLAFVPAGVAPRAPRARRREDRAGCGCGRIPVASRIGAEVPARGSQLTMGGGAAEPRRSHEGSIYGEEEGTLAAHTHAAGTRGCAESPRQHASHRRPCMFPPAPPPLAAAPGWQRRGTIRMILLLGAFVGVSAGLHSAALPVAAPQLLTRDARVWPHMGSVAPLMLGAEPLTAADVASTGVLLACRWGPQHHGLAPRAAQACPSNASPCCSSSTSTKHSDPRE